VRRAGIDAQEKTTRFVTLWGITILTEREVRPGENLHGFST
jgi:hypothetical protein